MPKTDTTRGNAKVRGGNFGKPPVEHQFTSTKQPTPEAKKAGIEKKKRGMELAKAVLELSFKGKLNSALKEEAAQYYGLPAKDITVEMMMVFRQVEKAIQKADTQAFTAVMDRCFGKPKQPITNDDDERPFKITIRAAKKL